MFNFRQSWACAIVVLASRHAGPPCHFFQDFAPNAEPQIHVTTVFYPPRHLNFRNPFTQGPDDWQLAVKYQNGSLALELFPAAGQYGENMTTGWYTAPR